MCKNVHPSVNANENVNEIEYVFDIVNVITVFVDTYSTLGTIVPFSNENLFFDKMKKEEKIKKPEKQKELYWQKLVECFFEFCRENLPKLPDGSKAEPTFSGSSPRDLHDIVVILRLRASKSTPPVEWTEEEAKKRLNAFLKKAYEDDWLSKNFILPQLNRFKDKVFLNLITPKRYEKENKNRYQKTQSTRNNDYRRIEDQPGVTGVADQTNDIEGGFGQL